METGRNRKQGWATSPRLDVAVGATRYRSEQIRKLVVGGTKRRCVCRRLGRRESVRMRRHGGGLRLHLRRTHAFVDARLVHLDVEHGRPDLDNVSYGRWVYCD